MPEENKRIKENELDGVTFPVITDRHTWQGKRRRIRNIIYGICGFLLITGVFLLLFKAYQSYGKSRLDDYAATHGDHDIDSFRADIAEPGSGEEYEELPEGQIVYKGRLYEYNDDIMSFLVLGVDSRIGLSDVKIPGYGGNADMIALVVLDEAAKSLKLIYISRDIMVPVQTFSTDGFYTGKQEMQLTLQYSYGDGREKSIRLMEEAVSELFYRIPIYGAGAIEMEGIGVLNDAVDGITLTVIEDLTKRNAKLKEGETVTLLGNMALDYIQYRDIHVRESNNMRIARQKQYIGAFFARVKEKTKENLTFPLRLYGAAKDHVLTAITTDQIAYLSTAVMGCSFTEEDMFSVTGSITKPDLYEEFRVNEEELHELIIEVFYRPID